MVPNYRVHTTSQAGWSLHLQRTDYFTKVLEDDLKAVVKPQYVDQLPKAVKGPTRTVEGLIKQRAANDNLDSVLDELGNSRIW